MRVRAVDLNLREQWKLDTVVGFAKRSDLMVVAWLLVPELVARESQQFETALLELGVQTLQALVLRREAALAGRVYDEQNLARIVAELLDFAVV
jgi:hypothetical protein